MGAYYLVAKETDLLVSIVSEQGVVGGSSRLREKNPFLFHVFCLTFGAPKLRQSNTAALG